MTKNRWAAILAAVMTVVVMTLRIVLMPQLQDPATGLFHLGYPIIALMLVTVAVVFFLGRLPKGETRHIEGVMLMPSAIFGMLSGSLLLLTSVFDAFIWLFNGKTPPPNSAVISPLDAGALVLTLFFGVLGGVFLLKMGLAWVADGRSSRGTLRVWALMPVIWIWMRLARYELSYASAVNVTQSFYDFVMLIFTLLFSFSLARYVSGVGGKMPRCLPVFALCTGFFCISGTITRLAMYMMGETGAYSSSQLATSVDFVIGVFAMLVGFALLFGSAAVPEEESVPQEETAEDFEGHKECEEPPEGPPADEEI